MPPAVERQDPPRSAQGRPMEFAGAGADRRLSDALVWICALVAQADGWVTANELESAHLALDRLPSPLLQAPTPHDALTQAILEFDTDRPRALESAEAAIAAARGHPHAVGLASAALAVATADGSCGPDERDMVLKACALLLLGAEGVILLGNHEET